MGIVDHSLLLEVRISMMRPITRKATVYVSAVSMIAAMAIIPAMARPVMADEVCTPETVPDTSGKADYVYKLDPNCTLHIGPTNIPSRYVNYDIVYPIQQHDKVRKIVFDKPEQTTLNENSSHLFYDYPKVESIEGIDKLDVSHVTRFDKTFAGLDLKEPADLSSWDVSKAYNFQYMFEGSNLDGFKGLDKFTFDLSNKVQWYARDFQAMFKDTTSTKGIDLSGWKFLNPNESNGLLFNLMFDGARTPRIDVSSFAGLDIGTGVRSMFANTNTDMEGLDKLSFQNISEAIGMFENARPTNQIDLSSWDTRNLNEADSMFKGSDIDKFSGMDKWNLESLGAAYEMYADLHPSHPVRIQANLPNLQNGNRMFAGSDLDMFPDIDKLQLSNTNIRYRDFGNMFENSTATYLKISGWEKDKYPIAAEGLLASPYIKYITFGNKTIGDDRFNDFYNSGTNIFYSYSDSMNVWDMPDLPKKYAAKKWAVLPIKPECEAKLNEDNNPDDLPKDCWDNNKFWVSDKTGEAADEELLNNETKYYQRIFFRMFSIPLSFNTNGVENATGMPDMDHLVLPSSTGEDMIPNIIPKDPSGAKVFDSWNTQADGKGKTYHPGDKAGYNSDSLDLYAQWKGKAPKVQFNNNGGKGTIPETKPAEDDDTKITVDCTNTPSRDGSTFIGWSKTKNDVLEGSEAGEKGKIDVCGYSGKKTITGLQGRTIDLYATWARRPQAIFNENRPKDMTALLPETKTIIGDWYVDESTPRIYVAPNIDGWYKGYSPDGVWQFDGWVNEDGSPFTGAYLERNDLIINAKWSKIKAAEVPPEGNNPTDDNGQDHDDNQDNGNGNDNAGDDESNDDSNVSNNDGDGNTANDDNVSWATKPPHETVPIPQESSIFNNQTGENNALVDSGSAIRQNGVNGPTIANTATESTDESDGNGLAKTGVNLGLIIVTLIVMSIGLILNRISEQQKR